MPSGSAMAGPVHLLRLRCRRSLRCVAIVVACVALAAPASATGAPTQPRPAPVDGRIGLRLLDVPTSGVADSRAQSYVVDHLAPGTTIHRRIELSSTVATNAVLYTSAATITNSAFLGSAGHTRNELSTWTTVAPGTVRLAAREPRIVTVTVKVPSDAAPGEQYAVVWAETRSPTPAGGGVVDVNRVGIRIYLSVGPGGAPAANFTIDSLSAQRSSAGLPVVVAQVHNTGGRALDLAGSLTLSDGPGGLRAGPFDATLGTTLPIGGTGPVRIALDKQLPAGPWDARIDLHSGLVKDSAKATITFPTAGAAAPVKTGFHWELWMYGTIGLALLILLLVGLWAARARRRSAVTEPAPESNARANVESGV